MFLVVSNLVQEGMFFDGTTYASISRNLAEGNGDILGWKLVYTNTLLNPFYEHPPLGIIIQSFFFKIFGDHFFVERVYSFLTAIISCVLIIKTWRFINEGNEILTSLSWFPVLLWIITPIVFWSYSNNMLENTMVIFDLAAVYLLLPTLNSKKLNLFRLTLAGIMILFAFLTKGPVGLFPIFIPYLSFSILKNTSFYKASIQTLLIFSAASFILIIYLYLNSNACKVFLSYVNDQIFKSLQGAREVNSHGRLYIIERLLMELIPLGVFCFLLYLYSKIKKSKIKAFSKSNQFAYFFAALGLGGSLPIIISVKQSGFYLVPAMPFFAISFALFFAPYLNQFISNIQIEKKYLIRLKIFSILLFSLSIFFTLFKFGKINRNQDLISDIYKIGSIVPEKSIVSISPLNFDDWNMHAYLMRYFKISLDDKNELAYYLVYKNSSDSILVKYTKLNLDTKVYDLYEIK